MKYFDLNAGQPVFLVSNDPAGANDVTVIVKGSVIDVTGIYNDMLTGAADDLHPNVYPYPTMTQVQLNFHDGRSERFECQDIQNQPGWSGGTEADLNQAVADIAANL